MERLEGRTVFVTGAASGIGLAVTEALVRAGARVAMTDRRGDELEAQAARLGEAVVTRRLDVTDRAEWAAAAEWVEHTLGPVEILINNAGIGPTIATLADTSPESFDRMVSIKLTGTFNGVHTFAPAMRDRREGHIVNTASMAGLIANPKLGAYTAAKFGVVGLSEVLRSEMAPHGVGVSVLCPGLVRTNLAALSAADDSARVGERDTSMSGGIEPAIVGDRVVAAIRADDPYIVTHPELRTLVADRCERVLAAFDRADVPSTGF